MSINVIKNIERLGPVGMQEDVAFLLLRLARAEAQAYVDWKLQLADDGVSRFHIVR